MGWIVERINSQDQPTGETLNVQLYQWGTVPTVFSRQDYAHAVCSEFGIEHYRLVQAADHNHNQRIDWRYRGIS